MAVSDIRAHWAGSATITHAGGQEILVGAPHAGERRLGSGGAIAWYRSEIGGASNTTWRLGGTIALDSIPGLVPAAAPNHEFGAAIAVPPVASGSHPAWIAVGAPGPGRRSALLFAANPGTGVADPLHVPLSAVTIAGVPFELSDRTALRYGSTLLADDFNGDGAPDLAVSGTDTGRHGFVRVYPGTGAPPYLDVSRSVELRYTLSAPDDDFGDSLASGDLGGAAAGRMLAVGAPGVEYAGLPDVGAVCQYRFVQGAPLAVDTVHSPGCELNPAKDAFGVEDDRFGDALAVGNFAGTDTYGDFATPEALVEELAVGASGAPEYVCAGLKTYVPTGSGTGTVTVFGGQEDFGAVVACPYGLTDLSLGATAPMTGFGTAIAVGDVQGTELPDLLMGAPLAAVGNGAVHLRARSR